MDRDGLLFNGGVGAAVTLALSMVPFSSLAGGAVAASGTEGRYGSGIAAGFVAGLFAMIPLLALFVPSLAIAGRFGFGIAPSSPAYDLYLALVFAFFLLYTVGLSVVGGVAGIWIRDRTAWDLDLPSRF